MVRRRDAPKRGKKGAAAAKMKETTLSRKKIKQRLHLAAERFNSPKSKIRKTWLKHAQELVRHPAQERRVRAHHLTGAEGHAVRFYSSTRRRVGVGLLLAEGLAVAPEAVTDVVCGVALQ